MHSKLTKTFMMMAALLLKLEQSVVEGAMEGQPRSNMHESNPENDSYLAEILQQLAKEMKRNNEDCPEGFAYVASLNQCYSMLPDVNQTRQEAAIECRKRHNEAHLPVIQNEQQHNTIIEILHKSNLGMCPVGLWTSGRRSHPFRSFSWQPASDDTTRTQSSMVITYTNWAKNRPWFAYGLTRNCLYMDRSKAWQWNQQSCEAKLCVMCQIDLS